MVSVPRPSFGDLLRRYRTVAGLTHAQLAERAGLSIRAISDLERGVNRRPRNDTFALLAEALQLSPAGTRSLAGGAAGRPHGSISFTIAAAGHGTERDCSTRRARARADSAGAPPGR